MDSPLEPPEGARPCFTLILDFWLPKLLENKFILFQATNFVLQPTKGILPSLSKLCLKKKKVCILNISWIAGLPVLGIQVCVCRTGGVYVLSTAPPQLCFDDLLNRLLCLPTSGRVAVSVSHSLIPSRFLPVQVSSHTCCFVPTNCSWGVSQHPVSESGLMGAGKNPVGCVPLALSVTTPYLGM